MKNWDMDEERHKGGNVGRTAVTMAVVAVLILGIVLFLNREDKSFKRSGQTTTTQTADMGDGAQNSDNASGTDNGSGSHIALSGDDRTSDELNIWDEDYAAVLEATPTPSKAAETDITTDGDHTMVTYRDGSTEWLTISPKIAGNTYLNANFVYQTPIMKYYQDGVKSSCMGVMISEEQNYVDYIKLKNAGVDFVMIRLGYRDADTGEIKADSQFAQNMKNAADAGLRIGIWFVSNAKNEDETKEEAEYVLTLLEEYELQYPVACILEASVGGGGRADGLTKTDRTKYALQFMKSMGEAGYGAVLGADKECLLLKLDLTLLEQEDIWLLQPGDLPDYPYFFSMWEYDGEGVIDGIADTVGMIISMKDLTVQ